MRINKVNKINQTLTFFLFSHLIIWTLVPSITNDNLPLDTIEALAWGSNLDWGFNKHPPLSAFAVEVFYRIFENQDWAYYFLSQLFVVSAFFVIFKFSEDFFKNQNYSLISILLLEGIYFYNFTTPEFNVNVCQLPFWALSIYFCWKGIKQNEIIDWLLFGLFAALGVLSKYLFIYLLVAIDVFFIYLIFKKKFNYKSSISLISFFAVLSFHLIWLVENNYITLTYALHRTGIGNDNFVENHLLNPLIFLGKQVVILIPFFIMASLAVSKFKVKINLKDKKLIFLIIINAVPIILMLLTSLIFGIKIRTMWMTPFYLFLGVLFVYIFQKKIIVKKLKYFISIFFILFIFSPTLYSYISITQANKRTDYPGKEIAKAVETKWIEINKQNENKINKNSNNIIGWDEWYAGNLSYNIGGKVFLEKFVDQLFEGNNDNNILITKSNKAKQVCELDPLADIYLINYFFTHDHHVCFMNILK